MNIKNRILLSVVSLFSISFAHAQGWPADYKGVMLQGFYWDSFDDSQWTKLEAQADELSQYFSLIWIPQSGNCGSGNSMGYDPLYYFNHNSTFGSEAQLRSMISTFKAKGLGTIADVVVNHRKNVSSWFDFPTEVYKGVTYKMTSTDIVMNDDGGATAKEAAKQGVTLSSNNDEGEDFGGFRDLDHKSDNVRQIVKAYTKFLIDDLGYTGFRYDVAKGFGAARFAEYNDHAKPNYSVGEYWDGNASTVKNWIDGTSKKSAAFDFPFRYTVRDAINNNNWDNLGNTSLLNVSGNTYKQYSVTFVENHDTEYRSATSQQDPIRKDTLAANAYMLTMPGTPCVFFKHWQAYKQEIKNMIDLRKAAGISNTSAYEVKVGDKKHHYAVAVTGSEHKLMVVVGTTALFSGAGNEWVKVASGNRYAFYMPKSAEKAWADKASGEYDGEFKVMLTVASNTANAQVVYTTDGTTPTAQHGTKVASGTTISITDACTLTFGLLANGVVTGIQSRSYTMKAPFAEKKITVYVNADDAGTAWAAAKSTAASPYINFWTWGGTGKHAPTNGAWPGDKVTQSTTIDNVKWFYREYTLTSDDDYVSFVWSVGTGTTQTVDAERIADTTFFKVQSAKTGTKYNLKNVTDEVSSIGNIAADEAQNHSGVYTIDGRNVSRNTDITALPHGVYIVNGKKMVK